MKPFALFISSLILGLGLAGCGGGSGSGSGSGVRVTTLAGSALSDGSADGTTLARFNNPFGVAVDSSGNVYVTDRENTTIRKIE